jgi:hypothetical protein
VSKGTRFGERPQVILAPTATKENWAKAVSAFAGRIERRMDEETKRIEAAAREMELFDNIFVRKFLPDIEYAFGVWEHYFGSEKLPNPKILLPGGEDPFQTLSDSGFRASDPKDPLTLRFYVACKTPDSTKYLNLGTVGFATRITDSWSAYPFEGELFLPEVFAQASSLRGVYASEAGTFLQYDGGFRKLWERITSEFSGFSLSKTEVRYSAAFLPVSVAGDYITDFAPGLIGYPTQYFPDAKKRAKLNELNIPKELKEKLQSGNYEVLSIEHVFKAYILLKGEVFEAGEIGPSNNSSTWVHDRLFLVKKENRGHCFSSEMFLEGGESRERIPTVSDHMGIILVPHQKVTLVQKPSHFQYGYDTVAYRGESGTRSMLGGSIGSSSISVSSAAAYVGGSGSKNEHLVFDPKIKPILYTVRIFTTIRDEEE